MIAQIAYSDDLCLFPQGFHGTHGYPFVTMVTQRHRRLRHSLASLSHRLHVWEVVSSGPCSLWRLLKQKDRENGRASSRSCRSRNPARKSLS
ncbi:hypothetical protein DOTSEDRAFT_46273 [Dothistroma septosporum NZE10]|uniref:Uncharacterized protein n=1 Tax=Dothistroma septosporum (strain NZE10 / CBS 128990) TaxID=675120 RepID=N1PFV7_DOTSN|nr:hypothetical protein DOTSEDRAFT_46273 [Dothistroma septosporum NZE10]